MDIRGLFAIVLLSTAFLSSTFSYSTALAGANRVAKKKIVIIDLAMPDSEKESGPHLSAPDPQELEAQARLNARMLASIEISDSE